MKTVARNKVLAAQLFPDATQLLFLYKSTTPKVTYLRALTVVLKEFGVEGEKREVRYKFKNFVTLMPKFKN